MMTNTHFWSHLDQFFVEWEMFQTKFAEKINIHISCSTIFVLENRAIYRIIWKTTVEPNRPQMTIWRMHIAWWISKAIHTVIICNTYFLSTATTVARTRVSVKLYVNCLPCLEICATIFERNNTRSVAYNFLHFLLTIFCHVCIQRDASCKIV
jgi:hypothetical protein